MSVHLRPATASDIEFLATVVLESVRARYQRRPDWNAERFYQGLVDDAADQIMAGPPCSTTYVIVRNDADVGRARLITAAHELRIAGLQVLPTHQNRGIGTQVIATLCDIAERSGVPVVLEVEDDNPDARRLYERLQFQVTGPSTGDRRTMVRHPRQRSPRSLDP